MMDLPDDNIDKTMFFILIPTAFGFGVLLQTFRFITGKDSASFAWVLVVAANSYSLASDGIRHVSVFFIIFDCIWMIWTVRITVEYQHFVKGMTKDGSLALFRRLPLCMFIALLNAMLLFFALITFKFVAAGEVYLESMWALAMCYYHPGGKSVYARAKAKIAEMSVSRRPSFAPA